MKEIAPRSTVDEDVRFGKPVVAGTRVPADLVLAKLAARMTVQEVGDEYGLTTEDIRAVLAYAAKTLAEEEVER